MRKALIRKVQIESNEHDVSFTRSGSFHFLNKSHLFGSELTDEEILDQLCDRKYQHPLSEHDSTVINSMGPDFMKLAAVLSQHQGCDLYTPLIEELSRQTDMPDDIMEHLQDNIDEVMEAMREIAESFLLRKKGTKSKDESVPDVILHGQKGIYKPCRMLAKGSAGTVYTATRKDPNELESSNSKNLFTVLQEVRRRTFKPSDILTSSLPSLSNSFSMDLPRSPSSSANLMRERARSNSDRSASLLGIPCNAIETKAKHKTTKAAERWKWAIRMQLDQQLILKAIAPTQKDSAENEYLIGRHLCEWPGELYVVPYIDSVEESPTNLWLVLRRMHKTDYGVDLASYIDAGFFQIAGHQTHSQHIAAHLLLGLHHIGSRSVIMRDVKPDNVLIEYDAYHNRYIAKWADYGLAVRMDSIRVPRTTSKGKELVRDLVGFWYDTQKLVPRPTWVHRRPPEGAYKTGPGLPISSYDMYMVGIIFCCMATGVDFPHLDRPKVMEKAIKVLGVGIDNHLDFELGSAINGIYQEGFKKCFLQTFGEQFGELIFDLTCKMLISNPGERPTPKDAYSTLVSDTIAVPRITTDLSL